jgi:hypothetical protein
VKTIGVRRGVSKGVEDGRRPPALRVGDLRNDRKAVSGVAPPQGIEGSGIAGPGEPLGSYTSLVETPRPLWYCLKYR